ncbi:MAG: hypothetical protein MK110_03385 [Fuerstiella sp.]|nr:hypothetical protein [Fuerstiella sp.]
MSWFVFSVKVFLSYRDTAKPIRDQAPPNSDKTPWFNDGRSRHQTIGKDSLPSLPFWNGKGGDCSWSQEF